MKIPSFEYYNRPRWSSQIYYDDNDDENDDNNVANDEEIVILTILGGRVSSYKMESRLPASTTSYYHDHIGFDLNDDDDVNGGDDASVMFDDTENHSQSIFSNFPYQYFYRYQYFQKTLINILSILIFSQ